MQTALTAIIALLSLSLVSSFLDKETFEYCFQRKDLRWTANVYIGFILALLSLVLLALPRTAQTESFSNAKGWVIAVYHASVVIAVGGFGLQAIARYQIMQKSRNQKTRAKEDNNHLSDSANRSVSSSEDSQQQELDTPKEDARKPQEEPSPTGSQNRGEPGTTGGAEERINSKEGTEGSRKPHPRKARKTGPIKRILRASKYLSRQLVQRISNSR